MNEELLEHLEHHSVDYETETFERELVETCDCETCSNS